MTIEIVKTLPQEKWHNFVQHHPQGNIFHSPEMFDLFARLKNHTPSLWAALDETGEVQALLLPINITLKEGLWRQLTTRAVAYGSVLCQESETGRQALRCLLDTYRQQIPPETLFTELRNLADLEPIQPLLQNQQFIYEPHLNFLINLDLPVDDIMQNIGKRTRKQIRNAISKQEVIITEATTKADVRACYDLIQKSYAAAQVYLADFSFFETAFEILQPHGMIKFFLGKVGDVSVASSVELPYKNIVYGWYSGVDRDYSNYYPGEVLIWHVLEWSATNGYTVYDFGGAGHPDEDYGVRRFKAKFGGELVNFGRNTCVHRPMALQLSKAGYEIYRRLR